MWLCVLFQHCMEPIEESRKSSIFEEEDFEERLERRSVEKEKRVHLHLLRKEGRQSVFSKVIEDVDDQFVAPTYSKPQEDVDLINHALKDNFIFASMKEDERWQLISAMQPETVKKGFKIIRQGSTDSEYFYVVERGNVEYIVDGEKVGVGTNCSSFGELALLYKSPRSATCLAATDCKLWKVDQRTFRFMFAKQSKLKESDITDILLRSPLLSELHPSIINRFASALTTVHFEENDRIYTKGEIGEIFYIIKEGFVKLHDIGAGDSHYHDQIEGPGASFGERALLTGELRNQNATAISDCSILCLSRETFETAFGRLEIHVNRTLRERDLMAVPIFHDANLEPREVDELVEDCISEQCFKKGEVLQECGEPITHKLHMIRFGRICVSNKDGEVNMLKSGDYFGSDCIKPPEGTISPRKIVCEENTSCGILSKKDIIRAIGDINRLGDAIPLSSSKPKRKLIKFKHIHTHTVLGTGAFSKVYLASHRVTKQRYALKMLDKRHLILRKQTKAAVREKNIMSGIDHPFIIQMISTFQCESHLCLLLELVQGGELFSYIHRDSGDGIQIKYAAFYSACILEALGHLHKRSICFRDLKPENIMVDTEGYCKLVDLGFAKVVVEKTYTMCGTPEYIAPEIIMSRGHDKAADYWSFGVVIYEMITGITPFYHVVLDKISLYKSIALARYSFPPFVDIKSRTLIKKLMEKNPIKRLGNLARGHIDVREDPFFRDIDFKKLIHKKVNAPIIPTVKNAKDDDFDVHRRLPLANLSQEQQDMFIGF